MTLTVELPNDLVNREDPAREALEAIAVEAYRTGVLTRAEAARLAGTGRIAFGDVLVKHGLPAVNYGVEEFEEDVKTLNELRKMRPV